MYHLHHREPRLAGTGFEEKRVGEIISVESEPLHLEEKGEGLVGVRVQRVSSDQRIAEMGVGSLDLVENPNG